MIVNADDIKNMEQRYRALFINSLSGFKSANLVGSQNSAGQHNLAIISSAFHIGANPPLMGMIARPHTVRRDTLENIQETGAYTLNHVNRSILKQSHQTSARYDAQISEFEQVGLTPLASDAVTAPYVQESQLSIALELREIIPLAINQTEMVIGEIVEVRMTTAAVSEDGFVDLEALGTLAVSSLDSYHSTDTIGRLSYAKPDSFPEFMGK